MAALETIEAESGPHPTATIIILHGLGAEGVEIELLRDRHEIIAVGAVRFIFPHAPVMPVTINGGYRMRAWYDVFGFDADAPQDEAGLRRSRTSSASTLSRDWRRPASSSRPCISLPRMSYHARIR